MQIYRKPVGVKTHWVSFENLGLERGRAGVENGGAKGHAFDQIKAGQCKTLLDIQGEGVIQRIWMTLDNRSPEMLRSLLLEIFWDGADAPAVSAPIGDFFGIGLGKRTAFENGLFSDPEGRSFNCFVPMPFRQGARATLTNESSEDLERLFYEIDLVTGANEPDALYFHCHWRREKPNRLGREFQILPWVQGNGRFLGANLGVITDPRYAGSWWGEGEVKVRFGTDTEATLCGTGTEDYIGTGWGQGAYGHRTQGCLVAEPESGHWCFYRYHLDDPIYFDDGIQVGIQTLGGAALTKVLRFIDDGVPAIPISLDRGKHGGFLGLAGQNIDLRDPNFGEAWCNFWRQDDWSCTAYFYLDQPENNLPGLANVSERLIIDLERGIL